MELIAEIVLDWLGDKFLKTRKIKPWGKTVVAGMLVFLATALFLHGIYLTWTIQRSIAGVVVMSALTLVVGIFGAWFVWVGHKNRWDNH